MAQSIIKVANIEWRVDKLGNTVPFSLDFNDIYYSTLDGLAESRYVFVNNNQLPKRFCDLFQRCADGQLTATCQTFTIAELGFGTGLNLLVTWHLWEKIKHKKLASLNTTHGTTPRLHFISTEKHPLSHDDFVRSLECWRTTAPFLAPLINKLINNYPTLVAGCHRIHLAEDVILDVWLGEAIDSLASLDTAYGAYVDAWYLDGFAPACNDSLWTERIFIQMRRLSTHNTTVATFSCAGVVKRGLSEVGFYINKVEGFGFKREMLTAVMSVTADNHAVHRTAQAHNLKTVAVVGAGISGLMSAWSLATRGIKVLLIDKTAPLAGASGNPRALLAPKMTPIHHAAEHLHTISYLYSTRFYQGLNTKSEDKFKQKVYENTGALDLLTKANVDVAQIAQYPDDMAKTLSQDTAIEMMGLNPLGQTKDKAENSTTLESLTNNLYLPQAGLVNPSVLADIITSHSLIEFVQCHIKRIDIINIDANRADNTNVYDSHAMTHCVTLVGGSNVSNDMGNGVGDNNVGSDVSDAVGNDVDDKVNADFNLTADAVIIACAYNSHQLDDRIFDFRKIRGQLSWFTLNESIDSNTRTSNLPKLPLKYGGYCATFTPIDGDEKINSVAINQPTLLLGASFVRNDLSTKIRDSEHEINRTKLVDAIPQFDKWLPTQTAGWQARVSIRAQTPDYHPVVGQVDEAGLIWTLSGMGSKGYAFAPLCAEALVDMMTGQCTPVSSAMLAKLSPKRARLQQPLT